jgi:predicted dehydrogenase
MSKQRVAVVGLGRMGQFHTRILADHEDYDLVAVVDLRGSISRRTARQYHCEGFKHYSRILDREKVDAVIIAVPTSLHHEVASAFLKIGVHCMVEKPIASTVDEAEDLIRLAEENKCVLQVGHVEHYNAAVRKLRELLDKPGFIECHRLGPFAPRISDCGVVLDLMIHDIDIVLQIVNSPIVSMDAVGVNILTDNEDIANVRLKFESGCTANLTVSRVSPKPQRKIRIFQSDTYVSMNCLPAKQSIEVYQRIPRENPKPGEPTADIVRKRLRPKKEDMLTLELSDFLAAVNGERDPIVTGRHACDALEVAVKIARSIAEQKAHEKFRSTGA